MSELPKRAEDKVNTFGIVLIGISSSILLWAVIVLLIAYYDETAGSLEAQRDAMFKSGEVRSLRAKQKSELRDLKRRKVKVGDTEKELVTVPIEVAMKATLEDLEIDPDSSLVPALGSQDQATIPAEPGRPPDDVAAPEEGAAEGEELEEEVPADPEAEERGASDVEETTDLDEADPAEGESDEPDSARPAPERPERPPRREREPESEAGAGSEGGQP